MKLEHAIRTVKNMRRYIDYNCTRPSRLGPYVRQFMIPRRTVRQIPELMSKGSRRIKTASIYSEQRSLTYKRLLRALRHFDKQQRDRKLPNVFMSKRGPILWDGNHRVTAALLLGRESMLTRISV
jgi:hypothetical protein